MVEILFLFPRAQPVELHNNRILHDLMRMTRLRLEACDREGRPNSRRDWYWFRCFRWKTMGY